ncbi:MAG: class I SAM-dependent methyltransferase [Nitrospinae bacterium]|nr:class I SAM-dependent methyltransferase [Nitrospinota bacterium]
MPESFDSYSKNYNELVDDAIRHTGYDADNLVSAKLHKLRTLFPTLSTKEFRLLDYGCGVGNLFGHVKEFFPNVIYTGVDPSKDSLEKARSRFPANENFQEHDSPEWENLNYDLIFSAGVFHHIPHIEHAKIIDKLSSILNPGGKLVIWEHNPFNPVTQKIVNDCPFDQDAVLVPSKTLKRHFNQVALSNVRVIYTTFFPKFLSSLNFMDPYLGWLPLGGQYLVTGQKD